MDQADQETLRYRVINKPSSLTAMYVKLMSDWDALSPDQFDDRVEDLVDEIEGQEIRLTKQKIIFDVTEQDQTYYQSLTNKTNNEIESAKKQIQLLEKQLQHEKILKSYKKQFEEAATSINKFPPAQESIQKIKECETERDRLEKACKNEVILQKQLQLHKLVSMIQDFRAEASMETIEAKELLEEGGA